MHTFVLNVLYVSTDGGVVYPWIKDSPHTWCRGERQSSLNIGETSFMEHEIEPLVPVSNG